MTEFSRTFALIAAAVLVPTGLAIGALAIGSDTGAPPVRVEDATVEMRSPSGDAGGEPTSSSSSSPTTPAPAPAPRPAPTPPAAVPAPNPIPVHPVQPVQPVVPYYGDDDWDDDDDDDWGDDDRDDD